MPKKTQFAESSDGVAEAPSGKGTSAACPDDAASRRTVSASRLRSVGLVAAPICAATVLIAPAPSGMAPEAWRMTAITVWMVIWWLTEAIAVPATALLPLVLMPLLGVKAIGPTASEYAHPLIFLFLGGFLLAAAMQRTGLHRRIALLIITRAGTTPRRIILSFMLATAFLSMWISNTATAIMMFAVGLSVIGFVKESSGDKRAVRNFGVALMLSIAYSASIGGVGTIIGTPPNALLVSFLESTYAIEITFFRWMLFGLPIVLIMLPAAWLLLTGFMFPAKDIAIKDPEAFITEELHRLGAMSASEKLVAAVFTGTALLWIFHGPLGSFSGLALDDTVIAIGAALCLFTLPVPQQRGKAVLDWDAAQDIPWGVLLLFGGGLALAGGFNSTGLAEWIGTKVGGVQIGTVFLIFSITVAIVYLTEITSNTASTATFLPILGAIAVGLGLEATVLTVPAALGASMAFMMPVATPPNAIVFSYEEMQLQDMVRAGFLLNFIAIAVSFALFLLLGPLIFGFAL